MELQTDDDPNRGNKSRHTHKRRNKEKSPDQVTMPPYIGLWIWFFVLLSVPVGAFVISYRTILWLMLLWLGTLALVFIFIPRWSQPDYVHSYASVLLVFFLLRANKEE